MIAKTNDFFYNYLVEISLVGGFVLVIIVIAVLLYFDNNPDRNFRIWPKIPRVIPFTTAARIQKAKAQIELENIQRNVFEAKHARLQQELVYGDLEKTRELESGNKPS